MLRVCYFGTYEQDYVRNRNIIAGLRQQGWDVQECHVPLWERQRDKTGEYLHFASLVKRGLEIVIAYIRLCYSYFFTVRPYDVLMVGYIGHLDVPLAWLLTRIPRRPLVFNPLISLYDTLVDDRAVFRGNSFMGRSLYAMDRWTCKAVDLVLLDTDEHIRYFVDTFGLPDDRFTRVFVGVDESVFQMRDRGTESSEFHIVFVGKYTPLHGIPIMMRAAKMLEDLPAIHFHFIGSGQLSEEVHQLYNSLGLQNVTFSEWIDYQDLPALLSNADLCLGIVGTTEKAGRVIPGKVFWALALGTPVLTGDSSAARELLTDKQDALLCQRGDPESMSDAIRMAFYDRDLLKRVGDGGRRTYLARASEKRIGETIAGALERLTA